jgi:hypothetical protein
MSILAIELAYGWGVVIPRSQYLTVPASPNGFINTCRVWGTNPGRICNDQKVKSLFGFCCKARVRSWGAQAC